MTSRQVIVLGIVSGYELQHWVNMNKLILILVFLVLASTGCTTTQSKENKKPNIILIMADDIGIEGLGCYGGLSYKTPKLDKLASEGVRFTHAYSQPLCTNTRIQLMTGLYNHRNWLYFGILKQDSKTIGHYMKEAGYNTAIAGKWQLQSYDPPDYPGAAKRRGTGMHPKNAGFDEYSLFHSLHTEDKGSRYADPTYLENGTLKKALKDKYGPDMWVDYINDYIDRKKDDSKPFFVYFPMALPHWPMVPTPDSPIWNDRTKRNETDTKYFKDMVEYMDKCVGRIVDHVDASGIGEDTMIIFYSDNGTHLKITSDTVDGPVAGGKGRTTDAGTRVPLIVRWTKAIKPAVNDDLTDSTDFIPTLREAAMKPLSVETKIDGVSFYQRLKGMEGSPRDWVYCFYDPRPGWDKDQFTKLVFARDKRFKLYEDGRLFDISNDVLEKKAIMKSDDNYNLRKVREKLNKVLEQAKKPL